MKQLLMLLEILREIAWALENEDAKFEILEDIELLENTIRFGVEES